MRSGYVIISVRGQVYVRQIGYITPAIPVTWHAHRLRPRPCLIQLFPFPPALPSQSTPQAMSSYRQDAPTP